jgi:hypothetical protein
VEEPARLDPRVRREREGEHLRGQDLEERPLRGRDAPEAERLDRCRRPDDVRPRAGATRFSASTAGSPS